MADSAIIFNPSEWDRFLVSMREQIHKEFEGVKGIVVHKSMNAKEAADFLHITQRTLQRRMKTDKLPFHKRGDVLYFFPSELNDWIKSKKK